MSETVRFFLESRVPELEDLFKKGLFSKDEIKEIVAKRTKFEHKIKRRGAILEDFLAYIHYETDLEEARKQRYEMLNVRSKHSVSDHSIVKYILSLYRRAVTKFRGNMALWDQYISFACESKSDKAMPKILASALQLHPESVHIWIKSANWEFKHLNNPASARALFMRGIRMNKESKLLWFEYFRMELEVASKLFESKSSLSDQSNEEPLSEATVYDGAIAIAVFKFAVKTGHLDANDAFKYFDLSLKYENMKAVSDYIEIFVSENIQKQHAYHVLKAKSEVALIDFNDESSVSTFEKCMVYLNQALNCEPIRSEILSDVIQTMGTIFEKSLEHDSIKSMIFDKLNRIYESGEQSGLLTIQQYIDWFSIKKDVKGTSSAFIIIQNALKCFPNEPRLLELSVYMEYNQENPNFANILASYAVIIRASPSSCFSSLDAVFKKFEALENPELMELALLSCRFFVPSANCIKYILNNSSERIFLESFDHSQITPEFNFILISVLIEMKFFTESIKKFICKLSIFSSKVFSQQASAISLLKLSLIVGDIELSTRLFARSLLYLHNSEHEAFTTSFEKLKDSSEFLFL